MPTITPTDRPINWYVEDDRSAGITRTTEITAVSPSVTYAEGDSEQTLLDAMTAGNLTAPPLPESGWLEVNGIYDYNETLLMVRQSHERTGDAPADVPALFITYRVGAGVLDWVIHEQVYVGTQRSYAGTIYDCIQAHVTQFPPPEVPALWNLIPQTNEWQAGVAYTIGKVVTYQGAEYECRQSHTSQIGWEPPNVLALWLPL